MRRPYLLVPLALGLLGAAAWLRSGAEPDRAPRPAAIDPHEAHSHEGPVEPGAPRDGAAPAPPAKVLRGNLRAIVEGDVVPGRVVVYGTRHRVDADRELPASGELRIEGIPAGPKNVVFLPAQGRLPASADTVVPPSGTGEVRFAPRPSATLGGTVVDVLQRPLAGVRLEIRKAPLFATLSPAKEGFSLYNREEQQGRGPKAVSRFTVMEGDGALRLGVTSDAEGGFGIDGVETASYDVEVSWKELRFRQSCTVGADNRIVVPGLPEAALVDPGEADAMARITEWLRQIARHPEAPEPYAAPLRDFLRQRLAAKSLPPRLRTELEARIDSIGRRTR